MRNSSAPLVRRILAATLSVALVLLAGLVPGGGSAAADTIVFASGWEDGQDRGLSNRVEYSREVAGYYNSSDPPPECGARFGERPRSGDYSLMMAGYSRAGYAYAYFRVFDQNIPVVDGTRIGYWIYHQEGTAKISVDGHFTDGTTLRDFGGGALKDQHGVPIHPAARTDPMNQWYYVEVDLTPAAGKTLDFIMFAFDNGGDGFTGPFRTYVDDLQVVEGGSNACIASVSADHWQGVYFNNMQLAGDPVMVRDDGAGFLDFNWGGGSPDSDCEVGADYFSVRWTRDVSFTAGTYRFTITSDDGFRLYVDDALKLERWINQAPTTYTVDVTLTGGIHTLELEYYENGGGAVAGLSWMELAASQTWAYPVGDAPSGAGWQVTNPLGNSWYSSQNQRWYRGHLGEDWARTGGGSLGEPVYAAAAGRVVTLLDNCGNYVDVVIIEHQVDGLSEPIYSFYGHLEADGYVSEGDWVAKRQQIGVLGDPVSFFPHLHFEIKNRTALVNPPFSSCADIASGIYIGAGYSGLSGDYGGGDDYDPSDGIAGNYYYHPTRFIEARKVVTPVDDCAEFVADLNYPDDTGVSAGETIRKGWRLDNCGDTSWSTEGGYRAVRTAGSYGPASFAIPSAGPGQIADLYTDITVPDTAGTYRSTYRLEGPRGAFGTEFWVQIVVAEPPDPCLATVAADRWLGEYFNNKSLSGSPVMVRDDGDGFLDFDWGGGSPSSGCGIGIDGYSARWTREIEFSGGTYRFTVTADDGLRLYIDGDLKLVRWFDQAPTTYTVDVPLSAGSHTVQLEFYENGGGAVARLSWEQLTDASCFASVAPDRWQGEYFGNMDLSGSPLMVRDDGNGFLQFDWGGNSPASDCGIAPDGFSVRWTRDAAFDQSTYRFTVTADDGFRLYIDSVLKLEAWIDQAPTTYTVDVPLSAGYHEVRLDYYENGGGAVAGLSWQDISGQPLPVKSKLTIHTSFTGPESMIFIEQARPTVVKILDEVKVARQVKQVSPGTLIVGRIWYDPWQRLGDGNPAGRADEWWQNVRQRIEANPEVDYWEGYNEPAIHTPDLMAWYAEFEKRRVEIMAAHGYRACIGNFSTGMPPAEVDVWRAFYPAIDAARQHGGVLGLHEYSAPNMDWLFDYQSGEGWLTGRYRKVYNQFLIPDGRVLPLVITECGLDGGVMGEPGRGWRSYQSAEAYMEQLKWYDSLLMEDSYVLGATIFSLEIPNWWDFDISGRVRELLTEYVRTSGQ